MKPVCLVTGAAGKLGSAICRTLLDTHDVAAVYRDELPQFPSQILVPIDLNSTDRKQESVRLAYCIQGDLMVRADIRRIVEVVLARFGRIDVVINSAADTHYHGKLLELYFDTSSVEKQLMMNCVAPLNLTSAIFQESWKNERIANRDFNRCVINVSSVSGLYVFPNVGQAFYSASKAALNFLTLHLAYELADYSVRVNSICPSRFPDSIPTDKVTSKIMHLVGSQVTGEIVEISMESKASERSLR
jgi:NAD(P)-dependent dehydrogenase (short-subunit alcohol dehydrogenase family)